MSDSSFEFLDSKSSLSAFLDSFPAERPRCAVDTEADSLHSYREKLCLIQFSCDERHAIIDPLAIDDMSPLLEFLARSEIWMHGSDFDMSILKRTFGQLPETIYDTQTAARLLGCRKFGLASIIEENFGVVLSKSSQRADWGKRPLPDKMLKYAVNDVAFIIELADRFVSKLTELERYSWFLESCAASRQLVLARPEKSMDDAWRISGWGKLSPRGLAYLRTLWVWRDGEAQRRDAPSFKIIRNDEILKFVSALDLEQKVSLPERFRANVRKRFELAVDEVKKLDPSAYPEKKRGIRFKRDSDADARFDALRRVRDEKAERLNIDGTLIASKSVLERLTCLSEPSEESLGLLLSWQKKLLFE